jgi:hypothetical protein
MQTFMDKQGGLVATAAVNFFNWFMKDSEEGKAFFTGASSKSSLLVGRCRSRI